MGAPQVLLPLKKEEMEKLIEAIDHLLLHMSMPTVRKAELIELQAKLKSFNEAFQD